MTTRELYYFYMLLLFIMMSCSDNHRISNSIEQRSSGLLHIDTIHLTHSKYDSNTIFIRTNLFNSSQDTLWILNSPNEITLSYTEDINNLSSMFILKEAEEDEVIESLILPPKILASDTAYKYFKEMENFLDSRYNDCLKKFGDQEFICIPSKKTFVLKKIGRLSTFDIHIGFPKQKLNHTFVFNFDVLSKNGNCCMQEKVLCSNLNYY